MTVPDVIEDLLCFCFTQFSSFTSLSYPCFYNLDSTVDIFVLASSLNFSLGLLLTHSNIEETQKMRKDLTAILETLLNRPRGNLDRLTDTHKSTFFVNVFSRSNCLNKTVAIHPSMDEHIMVHLSHTD